MQSAPVAAAAPLEAPVPAPVPVLQMEAPLYAPLETPALAQDPSMIIEQPTMAPVDIPEDAFMAPVDIPVDIAEDAALPAPAPAPMAQPAPALKQLLTTDAGNCGTVMTTTRTSAHVPLLTVPAPAVEHYADLKDGALPMTHAEIQKGGEYCVAGGSTAPKVVFGGMMFWHNDGQCHLPPTKEDGSSCCEIFMWQPNGAGYYYGNCSMKCDTPPSRSTLPCSSMQVPPSFV